MRTFHSGGVAGGGAITQGLPRVEELFEARRPKGQAIIAKNAGVVSFENNDNKIEVVIEGEEEKVKYSIPYNVNPIVHEGDSIQVGDKITEGSINPHELLELVGSSAVQEYIVKEVQKVYRLQGVDIDDKHIEIIVKQMLQKVNVVDAGDVDVLTGSMVNRRSLDMLNEKAIEEGKRPATIDNVLLGITKASIASDSFLSAASFQETTKVLTDAAIKGKRDNLIGLKENIIIGKLIPAGTGIKKYVNVKIKHEHQNNDLINDEKVSKELTN